MEKEQWKRVMKELTENKCAYCESCCPYKKRYIQIKKQYGIFYMTDAFCSGCYKLYLEGFPWSTNLSDISFVHRLSRYTPFDIVELEYY